MKELVLAINIQMAQNNNNNNNTNTNTNKVKFVYNDNMEQQFGQPNKFDVARGGYGNRTFANQRAMQSMGQG